MYIIYGDGKEVVMDIGVRRETLLQSGVYDVGWDGIGGSISDLARRISIEAVVNSEVAVARGSSESFDMAISVHEQAGLIHAGLIEMFRGRGDFNMAGAHWARRVEHLGSAERLRVVRDGLLVGRLRIRGV